VENDKILEPYSNITRETASQLQRFLGLNNGPDVFLSMRLEAVHRLRLHEVIYLYDKPQNTQSMTIK
jgi:hypothetical protein